MSRGPIWGMGYGKKVFSNGCYHPMSGGPGKNVFRYGCYHQMSWGYGKNVFSYGFYHAMSGGYREKVFSYGCYHPMSRGPLWGKGCLVMDAIIQLLEDPCGEKGV